jgi:L-ascorbate metabolism protein UlaG (beta-lactamase superfamily)
MASAPLAIIWALILGLQPGGIAPPGPEEVVIEYVAHACFRIHAPDGNRIVIDPYASRVWLGYDFPTDLDADAVLITHPHYDHDAGQRMGRDFPWDESVKILRDPGEYSIGGTRVLGVRGKHADPYGKEFGQKNTIWMIEIAGLRIVHLGDNGPLSKSNIRELGRVDILMMPIDGAYHILARDAIEEIRIALRPRVIIPMHYRIPDLESSNDSPDDLGEIEPWLAGETNVNLLGANVKLFRSGSLPQEQQVIVFTHSPSVRRVRRIIANRQGAGVSVARTRPRPPSLSLRRTE